MEENLESHRKNGQRIRGKNKQESKVKDKKIDNLEQQMEEERKKREQLEAMVTSFINKQYGGLITLKHQCLFIMYG